MTFDVEITGYWLLLKARRCLKEWQLVSVIDRSVHIYWLLCEPLTFDSKTSKSAVHLPLRLLCRRPHTMRTLASDMGLNESCRCTLNKYNAVDAPVALSRLQRSANLSMLPKVSTKLLLFECCLLLYVPCGKFSRIFVHLIERQCY